MRFLHFLFLLALALGAGCATEHYVSDARHPEIVVTESGLVTYRGEAVDIEDLPGLLRDSGLTKSDTVNIRIPDNLPDYRVPRRVMAVLAQKGFTRPMLVGERKSYSELGRTADERRRAERERARAAQTDPATGKRKIRYK